MKKNYFGITAAALLLATIAGAQTAPLTQPPSGENQHSIVTQYIGLVRVTIDYSSPDVTAPNGQSRRGQIWGQLVPYGLTNLGYGSCTECPWRAGANENTVFSVSHDVEIEGQPLPAGDYGLSMIVGEDEWTIIFSKNSQAWGSFFYDPVDDALRVPVKPVKSEFHEWLTYEFTDRQPDRATVALEWEDLSIPFTITVPRIADYYLHEMKEELEGAAGFTWQNLDSGSKYAIANGRADLALTWATRAVNDPFSGEANFTTLMTLSQAQDLAGDAEQARTTRAQAFENPTATALQIHSWGRGQIAQGNGAEALSAFKISKKRFGDAWPVNVSMMRGYSAVGDYAKALEFAKKALAQAPDEPNQQSLEASIAKLEKGEDVN